MAAVLSAGERGTSDLLALAESDWQPQTRRIFDQLRKKISGTRCSKRRRRGDPAEPFSPRFRIASRAIAATANCCSPAVARRVSRIAAGSFSSPSISRNAASTVLPLVRLAAPIEPEWLLERATRTHHARMESRSRARRASDCAGLRPAGHRRDARTRGAQ